MSFDDVRTNCTHKACACVNAWGQCVPRKPNPLLEASRRAAEHEGGPRGLGAIGGPWVCLDRLHGPRPGAVDATPANGGQIHPQGGDASTDADVGTIHDRKQYGGGATRSGDTDNFAFDLIPSCASRREARRWRQGERGHGRGNWQRGQPIAVQVRHLLAHANAYLAALERGDALAESARDDHLAAIRCNAAMLMWYEEAHPEMFAAGEWQADVE